MKGLRERLLRLKGSQTAASPGPNPEAKEGGTRWAEPWNRKVSPHEEKELVGDSFTPLEPGWAGLGVSLQHGPAGAYLKRICTYPAGYRHGRYVLADLADGVSALDSMTAGIPASLERLLFFDTETTGLGVGAGNVPFLIGLGYYKEGCFIVEQLLTRNPGEELAMLTDLAGKLDFFTHIVSYNGRTFDWPVLKNRFVLNRLRLEREPEHLDFLYPSRSLWKHTSPSCRLGQVEEDRLGVNRGEDVPGSMAPALYFQYLAEQNPALLAGVFQHNERDILSLAGLAVHYSRLLKGTLDMESLPAEEIYRLGLWLDKVGRGDLAERAMELLEETAWREEPGYLPHVAAWHKKGGRHEAAARNWQRYVEHAHDHSPGMEEVLVELAMHYEHRRKNYPLALHYAEEALRIRRKRSSLLRIAAAGRRIETEKLQRRIDRLREKWSGEAEKQTLF
jgi:hypothetical protein